MIRKFISDNKNNNLFYLLCILATALLVMLPMFYRGIPLTSDLSQHLQFALAHREAILSGKIFPGWAGSDNLEFGSVGIRFYPPLAYYLFAVGNFVINDWYNTLWINSFFWMLIGGVGMYFWAKEWLTPAYATLVGIFFILTPYHLFQNYSLFLFAEFAATGILPFCFLGLTKLIKRGRLFDVFLFALCFTALILTHIPATIIGFITLMVYGLFLIDWKKYQQNFTNIFLALILSLAASSFHWLKIITELDWVKHTNYTTGYYDFHQHLFPINSEIQEALPPINAAIILAFLSLIPLIFYFIANRKHLLQEERKITFALLGTGILSLLMTSVLSVFVWELVPILNKVQFPWRWLTVVSLIQPFALVFALSKLSADVQKNKKIISFTLCILVFSSSFYYFAYALVTTETLDKKEFRETLYGIKGRTGCECWFPVWTQPEAFKQLQRISVKNRSVDVIKWDNEEREFEIGAGESQNVRIATFYYPYWTAEINGREEKVQQEIDGSLSVFVNSSEKTRIKLYFKEPFILSVALNISLLIWLLFLIGIPISYWKNDRNSERMIL